MSSGDTNDPELQQRIWDATRRLIVENYCIVASSALLFYDSAISFDIEFKRIWQRRTTGATVIFVLTRYTAVIERVILLVSLFLTTSKNSSCVPVLRLDDLLTNLSYASIGGFTALRLLGIYTQWWPVAMIAAMWLTRIAISIYLQVGYTPLAFGPPLFGCGAIYNVPPKTVYNLDTVGNSLVLASDALLLVLTWVKTLGVYKTSLRLGMNAPMSTLLIRDGTMYFLAILLLQVLAIVSSRVGKGFILFDVWVYFSQVFNVIFLCRFMLNLRGVYLTKSESPTEEDQNPAITSVLTQVSDVRFTSSIVGNLGAPLEFARVPAKQGGGLGGLYEVDEEVDEVSNDPLFAGLRRRRVDDIELPDAGSSTSQGRSSILDIHSPQE